MPEAAGRYDSRERRGRGGKQIRRFGVILSSYWHHRWARTIGAAQRSAFRTRSRLCLRATCQNCSIGVRTLRAVIDGFRERHWCTFCENWVFRLRIIGAVQRDVDVSTPDSIQHAGDVSVDATGV